MLESLTRAAFLVACMLPAGLAHIAWLRSDASGRFRVPLDGGRTWRGKRLFGANKTWAGAMMLPPAAAASFAAGYALAPPALAALLWPLTGVAPAALGFALGAAFVLSELPNSFLKRRLDVAPGEAPSGGALRYVLPVLDRLDSLAGVLAVLALTVGLTAPLALGTVVFGVLVHTSLSALMHLLGLKRRAL
jgi:CDP-2,3-bis-(O-geranylgeranyl)-sn-glycerol synthase